MKLRHSFILQICVLLALYAIEGQGNRGDIVAEDEIFEEAKTLPQGASTLAFVFDVTGSMYDDLVQVIEGAAKILKTTLARREKPLYNYALVPFHDPEIGPITVTTDPEKFKFELRDLYVQGGGDCPEMSVGAIEKALQISLPSSYIYVFTDARSKDYNVTKNVLKLIQEKQSQVVFVMTGDCGNRSHTGFKVYEQIAATSSGQLFMLNKSDVDEVLNFVRLSIQSRKVYLVNLNDESSGSKTHLLPVDPALREITVSVSGDNPSITLRDPMGNIVTKENGLMELLEINNGYIVSLKNPKPGLWSLTVESDSTHTVRVTGLSLLDFVPGYSRERVESTSLTRHRPIVGIPTHLILNATGLDIPGEFTKVELVDLKGQIIREFSLQVNLSNPSIYIVPKFLPPNEYFFVRVTGYDKQNFKFLRMTSAAVSPEVPTRPDVKMADHTSGYYGEVATITCHVDSLVPFTVQWTKNGQDIAPLLHFADTQAVTYNINDANEYSEGHYTCTAANSAGEGRATTFLDVTEPPPEIMAPQNVSVLPGGKAILTCIAFSSVQFNMTWTKPRSFVALSRHPRVTLLSNGSIEVRDATQGDGGKYRCTATNEGGATHRDIFLLIQEMPKVSVSARNITFKSGDVIVVSCSARGFPSPDLVWTKDGFPIDSSDRVEITEENDLRIVNAMAEDSGAYACIATNSAGTDAKHVHMSFIEGPRVIITERYVLVKQRTTATLHCPTVGIPPPVITWYKNGFVVQDTDRTNVGPDGDLTIADVQDSDAGEYTCIARNDAGTDNGAVALSVGDEPSILQAPLDTRVDISMNVTMPCVSYGFPEPKTTWYKVNGSLETNSRVKISEDGSLFIRNLELEDEGTYVCVVSNKFGKKEFMAYLRITGLLHPLIALSTPYVNTNRGNTLTLTCEILIGNPPPTISWLKDNVPVDFNLINFMEQADDGSLVIKDVQLSDAGVYTCLASNIAGESKFDTKVSVNVPPTIGDSLDRYTAKQYTSVRLECLVEGKPRPSVLWEKDDQMISSNDPHFIISDSGSLLIPRVHARDRGVYKCLVSNTAGIASKNITLHVQVPPSVTDSGREISVTLGETVELPCKVDSLPPPTFSWKRNGVDISKNDIHYLLLGSGSLQITRARYEDSAIFTCVATNIVGNVTIDVPVKVNVPPVISPGPTDIVAVLGNPTIVPCESLGDPTPTVTWTRNGRDVNVLSEGYLLLESGSLQISSVLRADGGVYKCKVTNVAGSDEIYITLIVNEPPTIGNYVPDIIETLPHNIAVLPCPASGYPRPRVVWFKDDVELDTSPPDISIGADGSLSFINPLEKDSGRYTCVATNTAGNTTKTINFRVHVRPSIKEGKTDVTTIVDRTVTLECETSGDPTPTVTWKRNGIRLITDRTSYQLMSSGSLRITSVKRDHSGQYSCIVSNTAGSAQRDILLHVHEPPVIRRGTPDEISKHEGDRVVLPCPVSGFPRPDITWYKDGQELGFHPAITQDESGTLFISVAEAEDSGIYMCLATNNAGNSTHSIAVKILVGTVIAAGPTEISVPIGQPVTLPCEVSGDPIPTVTWDKERSLLVIDGKSVQQAQSGSLYISSVRETDAGIYVCTAANVVYVDTRIIKLNVLVGPTIIPGITGREISVTVDDETILPCKAEGIPVPDILWLKDGRQLTGYEYGMEIREDGSLRIFSGVPSDSGTYTCIARNRLGNVTIEYELRVNVPPFINGNGYIEITSILGNPVILPCENSGDPTPQITWEKNSVPLLINGQIRRILDTGSLQIDSTRETDSGEYACIAYNIAGSATKIIILTVQNPPRIAKDIPLNITARVNTEATLYCHASGIPRPTIVWLKNGAPVRLYGDDVSQREDGSLHIKLAQPVDSGVYTCMASNKAGNTTVNIDFTVYVAPSIPGSSFPHNETAVTDASLTLKCPVDENAVPVPSIYWLKDGNRIGRNQHGILIMSGGRLLQIPSVQITDAGRYTCIAVNAAGNGTKVYDVIVQVPPSIDDSELPIDIVKIEGTTLTLDCDSTAIPPPTLTWLKNGAPITPNDRGIRITGRGRHLHIANVEDFHRGQYTCVSSNIVGNSTKIYTLAVQTAPDIDGADFPNLVEVLQNWPVDLECPADANPPPRITWYKEGRRLSPREHGMRIMRRNTLLQIYSAQVFDSGNYRCIATNIAGNNSKTFDVKVIVPPTIREDPHFVNVPVGTDVTLPCSVQGIPAPKLTWHKDGTRLSRNSGGYLIADSGSLTISSASVADSGEYTCLASNSGGNATRTVTLEIQIPPSIQNISPKVKANVFETVTLRCPVTGNPPPSIHWYKGASALTGNGDSLIIKRAELSDAGAYTCYARSTAGFDSAMIHVTIFERPTIKESFQQYVVIEDQLVTMKCTAEGTPKPTIRWQREHIDISENDVRYRVLPNGYLHIPFARREDSGMFKCIAENDGGSAEQLMNLYVQVPPTIKKSKVEFSVLIYDNIGLPCEAEGIPKPTISWAKDGNSLDSVPGYIVTPEGTLYIYRTRERDSGDYVCTAINDAGRESSKMTLTVQVPPKFIETPTDYELEINEKIDLVCEATGVPTPEITWSLNGKPRPGATGGNGRSILTIEHARKEDEGTYLCTATNDVGQERFVAAVRIKVPPNVIELRQDRTIKEAASVTFHCNVTGDPKPYIIWQKDGREVEESNRIYKHRNGSLSIFGALNSDTGNYTCSAINDLGRADRIVGELSVTSRPHITTGEPQNKIVDLGQPVLINCVADGKPKPTIEWWTQGAMIQESERIQILANNSLLIVAARQEDNRLYNCKAVNTLGSDDTQTTVIVRVHGDWSEWDKWGACSVTCGQGLQTRSRTCDNPMPANGGRLCRGNHNEDKVCNHGACPIHGQWGDWMPWEECTKTCGQGTRSRTRLCDNPTPQFGGRACQGSAFDQQICNIKPCPVDGNWGAWGPWQECSESCGEGTQIRSRQCNNPAPRDGGQDCPQSDTQSRMCKVQLCSVDGKWSSWSSWSMCSKSCGTGERQRTRTCTEPAPLHNGRYCEGVDYNVDFCNTDGCPVHGGWSEWEEWGECSSSCNGGQQKRHRACINPRPSNGGRRCSGSDLEMKVCGLQQCPIDGGWSEWGDWTQCSKSCGDGIMTRYRSCSNPIPRSGGRPCSGDESQQSRCYSDPCPDGPAAAVGNIAGEINGVTFGVASLLANISSYGSENHVHAKINNIPNSVGHWMRKLVSLLTPIYWTSAYEIGQAVNGYTLTRGYFVRQTQVEFATGEVLRMDHQVSGLDENGQLIIDVIINGDVPRIPASVDIALKPYTEDYVQTGPGEIYAYSTRMFTTNGRPMPYAWNHTIKYDIERGKMPYLVEKLYATGLGVEYDPYKEVLEYEIVTSIARGDPSNQCPRGFNMDPSGRFCTDEDECSGQSVCSHKCHNKAGGYTCSCPDGMVLGMDGHSCQDVDECATNNGGCSAWQECINTEGSFRCEAKCSIGYNRAKSGTACIDINECIALPRLCDHLCMNTIGSYRCRCRNGYRLSDQQGTCRDVNECEYRNPCPRGMGCVNMPGSFRCENTCERGYKVASNGSCVDIDECMTRQHRCSYNQVCKNTPGGYECSCPRGYRSDGMGRVCQDINECRQNPSICSYECRNLPGTYECICPPGQKRLGNRKGCAKLVWDQDGLQQVFSTRGCDQGMQMINGRCEDINECDNPSTCQHECINTEGSYQCSCPPGYTVDKSEPRRCQDVDECLEQNIDCGLNRMCFNKLGSYECIDTPCPPGYTRKTSDGDCVRDCPYSSPSVCSNNFKDILRYETLALPKGVSSHNDLVRLVTYTQDGSVHPRSNYRIIENISGICGCTCDCSNQVPFNIRRENDKGILYTLAPLREPKTYQIKVQATSLTQNLSQIEFQTTFVIFISVSHYPY